MSRAGLNSDADPPWVINPYPNIGNLLKSRIENEGMKQKRLQHWFASAACGLLVAGSTTSGLAAQDYLFKYDAATPWSWVQWWGLGTIAWDGTQDANNNSASGSTRFQIPYKGASGDQTMTFMTLDNKWGWDGNTIVDGTLYTNLIMSFKIDPSSGPSKYGDYRDFDVGFTTDGWGTVHLAYFTLPLSATTSWVSITNPIPLTLGGITKVNGFYVKMWSNGDYTNELDFNLDNVILQAIPTNVPPVPPPTMALKPTETGLNLIGLNGGGQYGRFSVYTANPVYSWLSSPTPVTYAVTIKDYPSATYHDFQTHMFFVPGLHAGVTNMPNGPGDSGIDYSAGDVIFVQIGNNANNGGYGRFMVKTNQFNGNSMLWGNGTIANLNSTNILGTWSLTFNNVGNVTFTSPDGSSTNFNIPSDWVSAFDPGPMYAYFGAQPNSALNIGSSVVLGRIAITGSPAPAINDDFTVDTALNPSTWGVAASDANGVKVMVPSLTPYWLRWTLPDSHFNLVSRTSLATPWMDASFSPTLQLGASSEVLLSTTNIPSPSGGFFGMVKRVPSKLQVLLPGESNAPDTLTGKAGTPDPQLQWVPFDFTVNAVDSAFHIVASVTDTVTFTSTDPSATVPIDTALVAGTKTFTGSTWFGTLGTWTITATDATTNSIAPGTSTPLTITH